MGSSAPFRAGSEMAVDMDRLRIHRHQAEEDVVMLRRPTREFVRELSAGLELLEIRASHPGFLVRMIGGAFFVTGMLLMAYNTYRTVRAAKPAEYDAAAQIPQGAH